MKKPYVGILLLSSAAFWLCTLPIFQVDPPKVYGIISLFITVFASLPLFRGHKYNIDRKWGILLIPFVISSFLIPYPYNVGFILLAIGFFLVVIFPRAWAGVAVDGLLLSVQAASMGAYYSVIPSGHSSTIMSYIVYPLLKLSGFTTSFHGGTVFIEKIGDVFPFPTTWDSLGMYPFILLFIPLLLYLLLTSETGDQAVRRVGGFLVVSLVYLLVRYAALVHILFVGDLSQGAVKTFAQIFFSPLWLFFTFVPFVVIILFMYPFGMEIEFPRVERRTLAIFLTIFFSSFLFCGAFLYQGPGTQKEGRVLVDEIHSTWEPSVLILDKKWYGTESTYNSYSMIEWFKVAYKVDRVVSPAYVDWVPGENISKVEPDLVSEEITPEILQNYDILILKTPTMYTGREVSAIVDFVKKGGSLFVIGDHSNFAGTSTALNQITGHFGIIFEFDSVNEATGVLSIYERGKIVHPCAKYMPKFDFLTSCSIKAPITVGRVIPGYGLDAEPGEYASTGFFRETRRDLPVLATDRNWGIFHQCVAARYGKGRVVAFADSTTISNFRIFFGGSDALVIGCMEYLNYENEYPFMTALFLVGGVVLAGIGIYLFSDVEKRKRMGLLMVMISFIGLGSSLSVAAFSSKVYDSIPASYYDWEKTVCFDQDHSSEIVDSGQSKGVYTVFLIWTQRVGLVPSLEYSLEKCVEKGKTIVIADPVTKNFSKEEVELLKEHVRKGGNVFMMVDQKNVLGLNLIAEFGLEIEEIRKPPDAAEEGPFVAWGPSIKGGEALKTVGERVILARVAYGDGYFVLCTVSHIFRDGYGGNPGYMGYNGSDPEDLDEEGKELLLEIYNLEYELFEEILE